MYLYFNFVNLTWRIMFYIGLKAKINYKTAHPRHLTWESRALSSISRVENTAINIPGYTLIHLHANYMQVSALQHQYLRSCIFNRCIISTSKYILAFLYNKFACNKSRTSLASDSLFFRSFVILNFKPNLSFLSEKHKNDN